MKKNKIFLDDEAGEIDYGKTTNEDLEPILSGVLSPGIQIRDLKKTYTNWLRKSVSLHKNRISYISATLL